MHPNNNWDVLLLRSILDYVIEKNFRRVQVKLMNLLSRDEQDTIYTPYLSMGLGGERCLRPREYSTHHRHECGLPKRELWFRVFTQPCVMLLLSALRHWKDNLWQDWKTKQSFKIGRKSELLGTYFPYPKTFPLVCDNIRCLLMTCEWKWSVTTVNS